MNASATSRCRRRKGDDRQHERRGGQGIGCGVVRCPATTTTNGGPIDCWSAADTTTHGFFHGNSPWAVLLPELYTPKWPCRSAAVPAAVADAKTPAVRFFVDAARVDRL
jgi:hypothetical protein